MVTIRIPTTSPSGAIYSGSTGQPTRTTVLWKNLLTAGMVDLTANHASFDVGNIVSDDQNVYLRTSNSVQIAFLVLDLGASVEEYDTFAIANHNFNPNTKGTFSIDRYAIHNQWSLATLDTITEKYLIHYWDAPTNNRYVRFRASQETSANCLKFGSVWLGKRVELDFNPQIPIGIIDEKESTVLETGGGQTWTYQEYEKRGYEMKFGKDFEPETYWDLEQLHKDRGFAKPFFLHLAPQDPNDSVFFGRTTTFKFNIDGKDKRPGTWTVEEDV